MYLDSQFLSETKDEFLVTVRKLIIDHGQSLWELS